MTPTTTATPIVPEIIENALVHNPPKDNHVSKEADNASKKEICIICAHEAKDVRSLKEHNLDAHGTQCIICDLKVKSKEDLTVHI